MKKEASYFNPASSRRKFVTALAGGAAGSAFLSGFSWAPSRLSLSRVEAPIDDLKLSMPARDLSDEQLGFIRDMGWSMPNYH